LSKVFLGYRNNKKESILSRLGKIPVAVPAGVQVKIDGQRIEIKGSKGTVNRMLSPEVKAELIDGKVSFSLASTADNAKALWGLNRMLVENMIIEIVGVGYKAEIKGKDLLVYAGYSSPKLFKVGPGISFTVENQTKVIVDGIDKEKVGQTASEIRKIRKPEPYKGKGIKYVGEHIRRKAGKVAGK
jgi:large subunit ribosomal protein L6